MYDKNSNNEYLSEIEVIFQIIDIDTQQEINRELLELTISKDKFIDTKKDNYYDGEIDFLIDSKSYSLNMKVIDLKTKSFWIKKLSIDASKSFNYLSNMRLYYIDKGKSKMIRESISKDINSINCRFQYINQNKNIQNLKFYLYNNEDTLYHKNIPISLSKNEYEVEVELDSKMVDYIQLSVTDGEESQNRKIYIESYSSTDFFSNEIRIIRTIMRYVLPYKEYKKIKSMSDEDTLLFLKRYWMELDPNKATIENEFLMELSNRLKKVNSRFKEMSTEGWNTDRGRIYLMNGEPNSIRTEHNPNSSNIREIWSYQSGNIYIFEENSFGRYYLVNGGF